MDSAAERALAVVGVVAGMSCDVCQEALYSTERYGAKDVCAATVILAVIAFALGWMLGLGP